MNVIKRLLIIVFAEVLLFLSIAGSFFGMVTVYAAQEDIINSLKKGKITIYKYDTTTAQKDGVDVDVLGNSTGEQNQVAEQTMANYAIKGVEFIYLRVGNVKQYYNEGDSHIQLIYQVPEELIHILDLEDNQVVETEARDKYFTSETIKKALQDLLNDNTNAKNTLEDYIKNNGGTTMHETDKDGITSIDNLELGLYLLVETKVPEDVTDTVNPFFVELPFTDSRSDAWLYDAFLYPKNQTGNPTLDKLVRNCPGDADEKHNTITVQNMITSEDISTSLKKRNFESSRKEYTYADYVQASEGDVLDYILVTKIPHITSKATYLSKFQLVDNLSKGIAYNEDVQIAFYTDKSAAYLNDLTKAVRKWNRGSDKFTVTYKNINEGDKTGVIYGINDEKEAKYTGALLTFVPTTAGLSEINEECSDMYMVAYYTAGLKSDATVVLGDSGNPNEVTLEWRRTSKEYSDFLKDENYVYTYGFNLKKKFAPAGADATKVEFVCENTSDHYFLVADKSGEGIYHITGKSASEEIATKFSPSEDGSLVIHGVEADTYDFTEIHTANGYNLLKEPLSFKISGTEINITQTLVDITGTQHKENGNHNEQVGTVIMSDIVANITKTASAVVSDKKDNQFDAVNMSDFSTDLVHNSKNARIDYSILNSSKFDLPKTGGMGTTITAIGGTMVALLGFVLFHRKKKEL